MKVKVSYTEFSANVPRKVSKVYRVIPFGIPSGITSDVITQKGGLIAGTAAGSVVELPPGAPGQYLTGDPTSASGLKYETPNIAISDPTNFLLNGEFHFAQRQTPGTLTAINNNAYSADQWKITRENADLQYQRNDATGESGITSLYYGLFKKITNAGKFMVYQPIPATKSIALRGKTVIFQIKMKASSAKTIRIAVLELQSGGTLDTIPGTFVTAWNADGTDPTLATNVAIVTGAESKSVTTAWQNFSVSVTIPATSKNLIVAAWSDADFAVNDTLSLSEAGLFIGSALLAWSPRDDSDEILQFCERILLTGVTGISVASGFATSTSVALFSLRYRRKYKTPASITFGTAFSDWTIRYGAGSTTPVTAAANTLADEAATLILTGTGTPLTVGQGVTLRSVDANAYLLVEAGL